MKWKGFNRDLKYSIVVGCFATIVLLLLGMANDNAVCIGLAVFMLLMFISSPESHDIAYECRKRIKKFNKGWDIKSGTKRLKENWEYEKANSWFSVNPDKQISVFLFSK